MPSIIVKQDAPGTASYNDPQFFGGPFFEDFLLHNDTIRGSRRKAVLVETGPSEMKVILKGRFQYDRDGDPRDGTVSKMIFKWAGETFQVWKGLDWDVRDDLINAILRVENGRNPDAIQTLLADELWSFKAVGNQVRLFTGSAGDDVMKAGRGDQVINGMEGRDVIKGGGGIDHVWAGDDNDRAWGQGGADLLAGQDGNDRLWGGGGKDNIHGDDGDDRIFGGGGKDYVHGDAGDDVVKGGGGDDHVIGGAGADRLFGGKGDDRLEGPFNGKDGPDVLFGGAGKDYLEGGARGDKLFGGGGSDDLNGGGGGDLLSGGRGNDKLWGGGGRDVFDFTGKGDFGVDRTDFDLQASAYYDFDAETTVWEIEVGDALKLDAGASLEVTFRDKGFDEQQVRVSVIEGGERVGRFVVDRPVYANEEGLAEGRALVQAALEDAIIG
ncbi:calcium-binding protein [uncultured Albimonas sp.]|uniref:calcium-binding protein n=1 Tax=uncultured Albimonas sp. TaxID=1331701 RepID=UPI0030EEC2CC|tara:strand:+ start:3587 stop:4900 length:1314 start_codon:yes stop_codon:yes gene_type:complete